MTTRGPAYPEAAPGAQPGSLAPRPAALASSAPASAAAPSAAPATLSSFGSAPFAGSGPSLVEHASSDGRWVALCQARKDEPAAQTASAAGEHGKSALQRYLVAPGEELALDSWLGATADGRFALFMQNGVLVLWDSETRQTVDLSALGADSRLSAESNAALRALDFDAKSEHLLYLRRSANGSRIVLRTLSDGSERELDPGPGEVWRARFDPGGVFAVLQMITVDSNKNGKFDFPAPLLPAARPCGDGLAHFRTWEGRGDRPELVLLPLIGGAAIHEPELVMPVLDALLLRDENGALVLERGGKKRLLEPADCKGRIVYADAQRELFVVGCAQKKKTGRVNLELVTREGRKPLNIELASAEFDREMGDSSRLVALYPGSDSVLLDADRRELIALQPGDSVIATRQARALIRRGKELVLYDADARREQPLPLTLDKYPEILRALPFVFVSPGLVNLDTAQIVGMSKQRPLALATNGQILVAESDPDAPNLAQGPLRWLTPAPPTPQ